MLLIMLRFWNSLSFKHKQKRCCYPLSLSFYLQSIKQTEFRYWLVKLSRLLSILSMMLPNLPTLPPRRSRQLKHRQSKPLDFKRLSKLPKVMFRRSIHKSCKLTRSKRRFTRPSRVVKRYDNFCTYPTLVPYQEKWRYLLSPRSLSSNYSKAETANQLKAPTYEDGLPKDLRRKTHRRTEGGRFPNNGPPNHRPIGDQNTRGGEHPFNLVRGANFGNSGAIEATSRGRQVPDYQNRLDVQTGQKQQFPEIVTHSRHQRPVTRTVSSEGLPPLQKPRNFFTPRNDSRHLQRMAETQCNYPKEKANVIGL